MQLLKSTNQAPNSDPTYQQLRNLTLSGEAVAVNNFKLKRDAATFHLRSGTVCFVPPVQGGDWGSVCWRWHRVIPFRLFSSLRVSSVTGPDGQGMGFNQEDKNDDADFRADDMTFRKRAMLNYYDDVLASP